MRVAWSGGTGAADEEAVEAEAAAAALATAPGLFANAMRVAKRLSTATNKKMCERCNVCVCAGALEISSTSRIGMSRRKRSSSSSSSGGGGGSGRR